MLSLLVLIGAGVLYFNPGLLGQVPGPWHHSASAPGATNSAPATAPATQPATQPATTPPSSHAPTPTAAASITPGASHSPGPTPHASPTPSAGTVCVSTKGWNRGPKASAKQVNLTAPVVTASPGIHDNCDRLVLILRGSNPPNAVVKLGIRAQYGQRSDGHPAIKLTVLAPSKLRVKSGYVVSPAQLKALGTKAASFKELRWVKLASSTKGQTVLTVSVLHEHPFRIDSYVDDQGHLLVILDVAALAHGDVPSPAPS